VKRTDLLFVVLVLGLALVQLRVPPVQKYAAQADEGYYLAYALAVRQAGPGVLPDLFSSYLADPADHLYPNPLRVGYILLGAGVCHVRNCTSPADGFRALATLSAWSHILVCPLLFVFSTRMFGDRRLSFAAMLLVGVSPLQLALGRRALPDAPLHLFLLGALWFFYEALRNDSRKWCVLLAITFLTALLLKETAILLLPGYAALAAADMLSSPARLARHRRVALSLAGALVAYAVIVLLSSSSAFDLIRLARIVLASPSQNLYAQNFQSGPWQRYVIDFFLLSPFITMLAIGYVAAVVFQRRTDQASRGLALYVLVTFLTYNLFTKNIRYLAFLEGPVILCAVAMLQGLLGGAFRNERRRQVAFVLCVSTIAVLNLVEFHQVFVERRLYDPVSQHLLQIHKMVPWKAPLPE